MNIDDVTSWMKGAMKDVDHTLRHLEGDDILKLLGVERRRSAFGKIVPAVAFLGLGLAVGAGIAWYFAPKPEATGSKRHAVTDISARAADKGDKAEKEKADKPEKTNGTRTTPAT